MNLHIFFDTFGLYSSEFSSIAKDIYPDSKFINLIEPSYKSEYIEYCKEYEDELFIKNYVLNFNNVERIFFHSYSERNMPILKHYKTNKLTKIIWIFWSGEFYKLPLYKKNLYCEYSEKYLKKQSKTKIDQIFMFLYTKIFSNRYWQNKLIKSYVYIDYFATNFIEDYDEVCRYSNTKMKYLDFSYFIIKEDTFSFSSKDYENNGKYIMINHSSDPTLNHFEVVKEFSTLKETKNEIFLFPLSYGDMFYKKKLLNDIKRFKINYLVLDNVLSKEEYYKEMKNVKIAIFNCKIQQGLGNIFNLIWLGVKIFLNKDSPTYKNLKTKEFIIFSTDDLKVNGSLSRLDYQTQLHNRRLLIKYYNKETILKQYKNVLTI